jgi:hypothetical protein
MATETRTDTIRISDHLTSPSYVYNTLHSHQSLENGSKQTYLRSDISTERKRPTLANPIKSNHTHSKNKS